jgi:hypothetical protein
MRLRPTLPLLLVVLLHSLRAWAQLPGSLLPVTARSSSGQFIVSGGNASGNRLEQLPLNPQSAALFLARIRPSEGRDTIEVDPSLLAVSCERIKRATLAALDARDEWRGRVRLHLRPAAQVPGPIRIQSTPFADGWQYAADLPQKLEWPRFVRALVETLLLEQANRFAGPERLAQPPLWLTEGLTGLILNDSGRALVPELNREWSQSQRRIDPASDARRRLAGQPALTFDELSQPDETWLTNPTNFLRFQASATLFTHELLQTQGGRPAVRTFLRTLPAHLNWQTAFLKACQPGFASLLDIEKWWAVNAANRLTKDPSEFWSREATLAHLNAILLETAEQQPDTNAPPSRLQTPLAAVIATWDFALQRPVIERKLVQLEELAVHGSNDLLPYVTETRRTLDRYLAERTAPSETRRGQLETRDRVLAGQTARQIAALTQRLELETRTAAR